MRHRPAAALAALTILVPGLGAADLDATLAQAMAGRKAPALGALVMRDGKVAGEAVRGLRRNDRPDPARPGDAWLIGSDAKPMTAALVARLVDRGVLAWDAPLAKLLPDLQAAMRPEYRTVTLAQLLAHRGGFPHDVSYMAFFNAFFKDARPLPAQRLAYVAEALKEAPALTPGTDFSYSNTGFLLAAVAAERAAGKPYEELMRTEVFGPLGMAGAGFGPTGEGQPQGHKDGRPARPEDANPLMFAPAGNVHMSLGDWAKFCLDQMAGARGQGRLLKPQSYARMQAPLDGGPSGLGWGVQASVAGRKGPVLVHAGSDGTGYALVALFPGSGNGVLVVANAGEDMGGDAAANAAMKVLLPELAPPK